MRRRLGTQRTNQYPGPNANIRGVNAIGHGRWFTVAGGITGRLAVRLARWFAGCLPGCADRCGLDADA